MRFNDFKTKIEQNKFDVEYGFIDSDLYGYKDSENNIVIKIFYLLRKGQSESSPYIIFFNGGPGIGFSEQFLQMDGYKDFLPEYNIVFMDQRGTGFSHKPSNNLSEYRYYSSKYICYDAEVIRKNIIGPKKKWIIFGQSFGGHLVRKYLELYSQNAIMGISHGYGECSIITMKTNIEKNLFRQVDNYFESRPQNKVIFNRIKESLTNTDVINSNCRCIKGKNIIDIFAFYFGLYTFDKIDKIIDSFNHDDLKGSFINTIEPLTQIILNSGLVNMAVSYIDLVGGLTDKEIYEMAERKLLDEKINISNNILSTMRLSKNVINKSNEGIQLENMFERKFFEPDVIDMQVLCNNLYYNNVKLHILGSKNDTFTPIEAVLEEQDIISKCRNNNNIQFVYSDGNHREWKDNQVIIRKLLTQL